MGVSPQARRECSGPGIPLRPRHRYEGVSTVRYDLTVTLGDDDVVCHIGWTVRDASGEAVAIGTWMGTNLGVYTTEGALLEALARAHEADHQLSLLPAEGEY